MFIDNYAFNQPIIFEHKEQEPRWFGILCIVFVLIAIPVIFLCFNNGIKSYWFLILILVFFSLFLVVIENHYTRFNFYYIATFDKDNFFIGTSINGTVETLQFSRKVTYKFKDKSRLVYMRDVAGIKCGFRYDENFRKFLEEIQII